MVMPCYVATMPRYALSLPFTRRYAMRHAAIPALLPPDAVYALMLMRYCRFPLSPRR